MKLVKVEVKDFNGRGYKKTKLDAVVDEFIAMNTAIIRIDGWEEDYCSAYACASSINVGLKRRGYKHIKAVTRDKAPHLINESLWDKEVK